MNIILTPHEMYHAGLVGYRRNLESIVRKRTPRFPERVTGELFGFHILSSMAELAVAKYIGKYWSFHENKFSCGDVGNYEVRYSERGDLKLRERDNEIVIGVSGGPPSFDIVGWIHANDGKRQEWKKDPGHVGRPAYFVPHKELRPMSELPR